MPDLEPLLLAWRAQDDLFERVVPTRWGAVVSDRRYPRIQEPNYARVESREPVGLAEIESELIVEMDRSGSPRSHVVVFHPGDQTDLLAEASTRGERLTWDLVMAFEGEPPPAEDRVMEVVPDDAFWSAHRESARHLDVHEEEVLDQIQAIERDLLIPAGRRWFGVVEGGAIVALAALQVTRQTAYVDHVVTMPVARRRGHAGAIVRTLLASSGVARTYLLAEPGSAAAAMYERIGFRPVTQIASWISPIPAR